MAASGSSSRTILAAHEQAQARIAQLEQELARARAEAATASQHLHALTGHLREGLLLLDESYHIVLISEQCGRLLGLPLPAQQWLGVPLAQLVPLMEERMADPAAYAATLAEMRGNLEPAHSTLLHLRSGRVLERDVLRVTLGTAGGWLFSYRDVTAQREQEEALRLVSRLPERNPNGILRLSSTGEELYENPAVQRIQQALSPAERQVAKTALQALVTASLASGPQEQELRLGGRCYAVFAVPAPAEQDVTCYLMDVTERWRAEAQRDEQRLFYETVLDEVPVEIVVLDAQRRYLYANPQAVPDPAHRAWLLQGHTVLEYCQRYGFPMELGRRRHRMFARAQASAEPVFWDDCTPHEDGPRYHQRHFTRLPGTAPGQSYMLGCGLDVTARVQAEERTQRSEAALREQQNFMQQVLDTSPNPVYVRDAQGEVVFGNNALFRLDEPASAPGAEINDERLRQAKAHEAAQYAAVDAQVLATGQEARVEDPFTMPSGELRWFYTVKQLLVRSDGTRQVLAVSTDITELKAAQLAAEAAATARENFLANMSHEIRTPLNGVLGMAAALAKTRLSAPQRRYLDIIRSSGTHLLGVLNNVLEVAKLNSGKLELEQTAFHLPDSVAQVVAPLVLQAEAKGLVFSFERLALASPWVLSDPFRLNQVLLNLLANAIKFTEQGRITLREVLVAETEATFLVRFEVADTGIGIGAEAVARIFESFTQAHPDTARRYGGTGLGLTISRALVAQLGGELTVTSTPGMGSTFAFTLPLHKAAPPAVSQSLAILDTGQLRGTRVLLAEDNPLNRAVAGLHLRQWGVVVEEAEDGPTAWRLLEQKVYDVVLMDVQMPGLSGLTITRRLRQHPDPVRAGTPILALTASTFDQKKYLAAGFDDHLPKPFAEEELHAKLVGLLSRPAEPALPYDLTRLRQQAKGHADFVTGMVNSFLTHMPRSLAALHAAAAAGNWPQVADLAHHIKPNLLLLGVAGASAPLLLLEEPPAAQPPPDEPQRQAAVARLLAASEAALLALPTELQQPA